MLRPSSPLASRRISCRGRETISRIVVFDDDYDRSAVKVHHGLTPRFDEHHDYDSCLSPNSRQTDSCLQPAVLLHDFLRHRDVLSRSGSTDDTHDYDSCISPVATPRLSRSQVEDLKASTNIFTFPELYKMLAESGISHFVVRHQKGRAGAFEICPEIAERSVIVSGSFNPLHVGHENLARRAVCETPDASGDYYFEISTVNVDKGPLSADDAEKRVAFILSRGHYCILTNAILYDAKAELFPNCLFAIGFDTYIRVVNPAYYPRVTGGLDATLARIEAQGCEFFVGGRVANGRYKALAPSPRLRSVSTMEETIGFDINAGEPTSPRHCKSSDNVGNLEYEEEPMSPIFSGIPGFRYDISSTEIRQGKLLQFASRLPP